MKLMIHRRSIFRNGNGVLKPFQTDLPSIELHFRDVNEIRPRLRIENSSFFFLRDSRHRATRQISKDSYFDTGRT